MSWPFGNVYVLLAAAALDLATGDPPNRLHPVAAMGWLIGALRRRAPSRGRWRPLLAGLGIVGVGVGLAVAAGMLVLLLAGEVYWVGLLAEVILLKMTFSVR